MIKLRGIAWDHVRGFAPLVATSKEFQQRNSELSIIWDKHSLKDFEDFPVEILAETYDLILLDHPSIGENVKKGVIVPLDEWISSSVLEEQAQNSVGPSYQSYHWEGHQWAFAIDAAAQVSAYRSDLLNRMDLSVPTTWDEVLNLVSKLPKTIKMAIPLNSTHAFCSFLTIYSNFNNSNSVDSIETQLAMEVLDLLQFLSNQTHAELRYSNPIQVLDRMSSTNDIAYVPIIFGYCNYSQANFRTFPIHFADIPSKQQTPIGGVLGGVGLAISAHSKHIEAACQYAEFVSNVQSQQGTYFTSGGQPGHLQAWSNTRINELSNHFFARTIHTMEGASMRPRAAGSIHLQEQAGQSIHRFLSGQQTCLDTAQSICQLFDAILTK
ncbi:carbohydrate ABC transporter substrate-binding protein, CUT1 family [Seinonella peptonophila]|uniref:Carbohydrate ABC transporter substrate-binding protein, CUT1 family n=1 Tax=Seinonella peptonophila TaxID=112248 RepID=A0A1M4T395_9BACL|nr:extracellular solute-binding protein [Seinonella peptonophila]SHE38911.1 carbohydrate ABC transporter substrate-binding protein, CUT1 family [Seinonella peptonophila]